MGGDTAEQEGHAVLDGIAAVIRAHDRVGAVRVTDGAGGGYLVTIAGVLLVASYPTPAASLAVEGIGPNRLFAATPHEMQRRATVVAAMTETARRHG